MPHQDEHPGANRHSNPQRAGFVIARNFRRYPEALALQAVLELLPRPDGGVTLLVRPSKFQARERIDDAVLAYLRTREEQATVAEVAQAQGLSIMVAAYSLRRLGQLGWAVKRVISMPVKGRQTNTVVTYLHAHCLGKAPSVFPHWLMPPLPDIDFSRRLVAGVAGFMQPDEPEDKPQENVA